MFLRRLVAAVSLALTITTAQAVYSDGIVKIGVLTDLSGPYAEPTGAGSVLAARMAVEDFQADKKGMKVEVVSGDHKNKAEIGLAIAKQWYEQEKVDVIVDVPTSSVALAVSELTREKRKALLVSSAASSDLTGKNCSPNTIHWTLDTWALANSTGYLIVVIGGKTWTFLTSDYAFGHKLQSDTETAVIKAGGKVVGNIVHPFPALDFTPYIKQAQASGAKIIGLANAGADTINAIVRGSEMGVGKNGQQFAGLLVTETDVHKLGLEKAQGILLTAAFYWDMNAKTRAWSRRFFEKQQRMPSMGQAGVYAAVMHYLAAVEALKTDDGTRAIAKMKTMRTDDLFGFGFIRQDGRKMHNMYLFEVKKPSESKEPWDYFKLRGTIPPDSAFRPMKDGGCPMVENMRGRT